MGAGSGVVIFWVFFIVMERNHQDLIEYFCEKKELDWPEAVFDACYSLVTIWTRLEVKFMTMLICYMFFKSPLFSLQTRKEAEAERPLGTAFNFGKVEKLTMSLKS